MRGSTKKIRYDDMLGGMLNLNARTKKELQLQSRKRITPTIHEERGKEDERTLLKAAHAPPKHRQKYRRTCRRTGRRTDSRTKQSQFVARQSRFRFRAWKNCPPATYPCDSRPFQFPFGDWSQRIDGFGGTEMHHFRRWESICCEGMTKRAGVANNRTDFER